MSMAIMMGIMGGQQILSGIGSSSAASGIAKEQRKMAELTYQYNKKEIERAFEQNISNMFEGYTEKRYTMVKQATQASSTLNTITANKANVDTEFNSYRVDSINKLDQDFISNINQIAEEQIFNAGELTSDRIASDLANAGQNQALLDRTNQAEAWQKQNAMGQVVSGAFKSASAGMEYYQKNYSSLGTEAGTKSAVDVTSSNEIAGFGSNKAGFKFGFGGI